MEDLTYQTPILKKINAMINAVAIQDLYIWLDRAQVIRKELARALHQIGWKDRIVHARLGADR